MRGRAVNIGAATRDGPVRGIDPRHAEIGDLNGREVGGQKQILRFYIAVDYAGAMGMAQAGTDLFDITKGLLEREDPLAHQLLQVTAGQVLEDQVMKDGPNQVAGR